MMPSPFPPKNIWDVVVVGAGPGGAAAAKVCVETGFRTLVLERRAWPRDKVCSGMVMGPWAQQVIQDHFGDIPQEVLVPPRVLRGHQFHVPGAPPEILDWPTPLAWRKDLDAWLLKKAQAAGVEVRDRTRLIRVNPLGSAVSIRVATPSGEQALAARWLIGADGAASTVRKCLFPNIKTAYSTPVREYYPGSLNLEHNYFHWFFPRGRPRPRFNVNHKGEGFLIEGSGIRELRADIRRLLEDYGYDPAQPPHWKDGCLIAKLHEPLLTQTFIPARGNSLLVGDAAGLIFPITFEGIGSALQSGVLAAEAVRRSAQTGREAAGFYLDLVHPVLQVIEDLLACQETLAGNTTGGSSDPKDISRAIKTAYERTLKII